MNETVKQDKRAIFLNKLKTWFSQPQNIILLLFGIVLTFFDRRTYRCYRTRYL